MDRRTFLLAMSPLLATAAGASAQSAAPPAQPPAQRPPWGQQAEKEFRLGRGLAPKLMTEAEWKEHQAKMRTMTPDERTKYREEVHQKMVERAKEKGVTVPPSPGPAGQGPRKPGS